MAGNGRYELTIVKADGTALSQITDSMLMPNQTPERRRAHATLDPTISFIRGAAPVCRFTTQQVGSALTLVGIDGLDCASGLELGFIERAAGGAYEATGLKASATKCLIVPESLSVSQDGDAEIAYACYCYSSNGTTAPLADGGTAIPTGTPEIDELFTLGQVTVNSVALGQVLGWRIDFGIRVAVLKADGLLYPTIVHLDGPREPSIEITLADLDEVTDAKIVGAQVDSVVLNLKKRSTTGGGLAGSGDKTITATKAHLDLVSAGGSFPGEATAVVRVLPIKSGANAILAVA